MPTPILGVDQNVRLVDGNGVAFGTLANPFNSQITGAGSGGTSVVDEAAWTAATSALTPAGGVFNDSAAALTSGQQGTLRMTPNRAPHANLRNQAGTEIATSSNPLRVDPTGGTTQPISAVSLPLPTGAATDRATAGAPASVELSDGAAFYTGAKTGQLPAALVGTRLDVNVGKVPGTISSVNSSTATLLANAVFTGTSEDVSGVAVIEVSVLADQVSAAGGLSLQFSSDGTHWDFVQGVTIGASAGAAFAVCPCAQFFRVVYTNGAVNQTAFRLQTVYRPVAGVQSLATFQDVNAALSPTAISQRVAADMMIQDAADNVTSRIRCAKDLITGVGGSTLLGQAAGIYQTSDTKFYPWVGTQANGGFVQGPVADGVAVSGNPLLMGGFDGTAARRLKLNTDGSLPIGGFTPAAPTCVFTRGANVTAYTIGDEVGTASTAPTTVAVGRFNGASGVITGAQVVYSSYAATIPQLVVLLFSATVTLAGDNAQLNLSDGDAALCIGFIPLTATQSGQYSAGAPVSAGNTIFKGAPTDPIHFTCGGSQTTIYAAVITLNAWTPISNSETLNLMIQVEGN